ncbi:MAG: type II toxin-antitoxin system VapC family toxin [Mesorhizobium sp.]|nr:type II toxin-antitoxin system VapC family toxin [Mesorhizobium sp.]
MKTVLDASAVLAFLNRETGGDIAGARLSDAAISVANVIEIGSKLMDGGMTHEAAWEAIELLDAEMVEIDLDLASLATALRQDTRHKGLSLADRLCLATAIRKGATAVTADRAWASLDLPCPIEVIR